MRKTIPIPINEAERLAVLQQLCILDTPSDPAFDLITHLATQVFNVSTCMVSLIDQKRQWFKSKIGIDVVEIPRENAFCSYAINIHTPMIVFDACQDERFADNALVTGAPYARFYAGAPLLTKEGLCLGTLCIMDTAPRATFDAREQAMLESLATIVLGRIETLGVVGYVDPLTLLPNRTRFLEDIEQWVKDLERPLQDKVVVVVDFCGLEYFNDMMKALGYRYAEQFLVSAKERLRNVLPAKTTIYRLGLTQVAFTQDAPTGGDLVPLFQLIVEAFSVAIDSQGIPHNAKATMGALRLDRHTNAAELYRSLLVLADNVRQRGGQWGFYERSRDEEQKRAFQILSALPQALATSGQLSLHYQPRVDLQSGECVAVEALLRWQHPELGNIPPAEFIPLAEKTALISQVTQWVLAEALPQMARWQQHGYSFGVSINVSAVDLDQESFVDDLCCLLDQHDVDRHKIELEFTESALTHNPRRLTEHLHRIRSMGIRLSIDDFGTGYSNLTYLKNLPANSIKIDQSFICSIVTDDRDRTIVPSLIRLAHDLGHRVVAEGIETKEAYDALVQWSCNEGQGYWISRPLPPKLLEEWLARRHEKAQRLVSNHSPK